MECGSSSPPETYGIGLLLCQRLAEAFVVGAERADGDPRILAVTIETGYLDCAERVTSLDGDYM